MNHNLFLTYWLSHSNKNAQYDGFFGQKINNSLTVSQSMFPPIEALMLECSFMKNMNGVKRHEQWMAKEKSKDTLHKLDELFVHSRFNEWVHSLTVFLGGPNRSYTVPPIRRYLLELLSSQRGCNQLSVWRKKKQVIISTRCTCDHYVGIISLS
jgi:hypothetical protein